MSDAARKLMEDKSGKNQNNLIISDDKNEKERKEIMESLKKYEKDTDPKHKKNLFFKSVKQHLEKDQKN